MYSNSFSDSERPNRLGGFSIFQGAFQTFILTFIQ